MSDWVMAAIEYAKTTEIKMAELRGRGAQVLFRDGDVIDLDTGELYYLRGEGWLI